MTISTDELAMRRESDAIAARRVDVIRPPRSSSCPPHAALLHRLASLITTEDLPPATVTVTPDREVTVDLSRSELVECDVRRWSAALDLDPVTEAATEVGGFAATSWSTSGYDGTGTHWTVIGTVQLPTPITDRFGVGIGPSS